MDQIGAMQAHGAQSSTRITSNMQVNVESDQQNFYSDEEDQDDQNNNGENGGQDFDFEKVIKKFHDDIDKEVFF